MSHHDRTRELNILVAGGRLVTRPALRDRSGAFQGDEGGRGNGFLQKRGRRRGVVVMTHATTESILAGVSHISHPRDAETSFFMP